jgi:hypothetical protein
VDHQVAGDQALAAQAGDRGGDEGPDPEILDVEEVGALDVLVASRVSIETASSVAVTDEAQRSAPIVMAASVIATVP